MSAAGAIEVVQKCGISSHGYCFRCRKHMKGGEQIQCVPYDLKHNVYRKRNKKLGADHVLWFHAHVKCHD